MARAALVLNSTSQAEFSIGGKTTDYVYLSFGLNEAIMFKLY